MSATAQEFTQEERSKYIGASEIASVLGLDKYKTALDLYNEKLGLVPSFEGNQHTQRGKRLEGIAAELFEDLSGQALVVHDTALVHPDYPFIVGHIDRLFQAGEGQIAEIKCPSVAAFRKYQRQGLPESMIIQMQVYLGLAELNKGTWIVFCADQMDIASFEVEFEQTIYDAAIRAAKDFWLNHVIPGVPPAAVKEDKPEFEITKVGGSIIHRDDDVITKAVSELVEAKQLVADAAELEELAKKGFKEAVEFTHGVYQVAGKVIHFQPTAGRKTLDKKALAAAHPTINLSSFETTGKPSESLRIFNIKGE